MSKNNIYCGIDLHKQKFDYVMMTLSGAIIKEGTCSTDLGAVTDFASSLSCYHHLVLEPIQNSYWFISHFQPYVGSVHLANPSKVRLIAESRLKNDRIDARILADLLRVGYLPEVYIPDDEILGWRSLISHRIRLVKDRTRLKNRILGLINREGHKIPFADPFCQKGRAQIDSLELTASTRQMTDNYLILLDLLSSQISEQDKKLEEIAATDEIVTYLRTIDGVGSFTAVAIRAIVGDIHRFRNVKAFAAYTGLIPGYRHSADTVHNGPITKQGNATLRWVLVQAAIHATRRSPYLKRMYQRLCFRSSVGKARVAVAHALARIIYHVWMEARPYYR